MQTEFIRQHKTYYSGQGLGGPEACITNINKCVMSHWSRVPLIP